MYSSCEAREISRITDRYEELRVKLNPDALLLAARQKAELADFGDEDFLLPYKMLLDCVARDVDFSDDGLEDFKYHVVRCLVNRLRIRQDFRLHPEILEEDVSDPIVVVGLPRSGTTKMQRILSSLPQNTIQKTFLWQMLNPAPFPNARSGAPDPRILAAAMGRFTSDNRPDFEVAHRITAKEPEEDGFLCDSTFDDWIWSSIFAPSDLYHDWVIKRPHLPNYQHLHRMYQYLQWQNGGKRNRRWVSKNVQHIAYLGELLKCFPQATIVNCHRTPQVSIPSLAKLTMEIWRPIVRQVEPEATGQMIFKWWQTAIAKYLESRRRADIDQRIIDIKYERVRSDAINVVREIYERTGKTLSEDELRYVTQWEENNEEHKRGRHTYSLEEFGLSETQIERGFGEYIERFCI